MNSLLFPPHSNVILLRPGAGASASSSFAGRSAPVEVGIERRIEAGKFAAIGHQQAVRWGKPIRGIDKPTACVVVGALVAAVHPYSQQHFKSCVALMEYYSWV